MNNLEENAKSKEVLSDKHTKFRSDSNLETAKLELAEHMRSFENEVEYSDKKDKNLSDMDDDKLGKWCKERLNIHSIPVFSCVILLFDFDLSHFFHSPLKQKMVISRANSQSLKRKENAIHRTLKKRKC